MRVIDTIPRVRLEMPIERFSTVLSPGRFVLNTEKTTRAYYTFPGSRGPEEGRIYDVKIVNVEYPREQTPYGQWMLECRKSKNQSEVHRYGLHYLEYDPQVYPFFDGGDYPALTLRVPSKTQNELHYFLPLGARVEAKQSVAFMPGGWFLETGEQVVDRPDSHIHPGAALWLPKAVARIGCYGGRDEIEECVEFDRVIGDTTDLVPLEHEKIYEARRYGRLYRSLFVDTNRHEPSRWLQVHLKRVAPDLFHVMTAYLTAGRRRGGGRCLVWGTHRSFVSLNSRDKFHVISSSAELEAGMLSQVVTWDEE